MTSEEDVTEDNYNVERRKIDRRKVGEYSQYK